VDVHNLHFWVTRAGKVGRQKIPYLFPTKLIDRVSYILSNFIKRMEPKLILKDWSQFGVSMVLWFAF
jgi:hypothetical protein